VLKNSIVLVLLVVSLACKRDSSPAPASAGTPSGAPATAAPGASGVKPVPAQLPDVVAKVNDESITRSEFENAIKALEGRAGSPIPAERRDEVFRQVLDQLVSFRVLSQETRSRKLTVTEAQIDGELAPLRQQFPGEAEFVAALKQRGTTLEQIRNEARSNLLISQMMRNEIEPTISVQPKDVSDFYEQNRARFKQDETVRASHILIAAPEGSDDATKKKARAEAEAVLAQVRKGEQFDALAKKRSQDSGSAGSGGDLGFFGKGQMVPPFEAAAFALKKGAVSEVVESLFGYHVIKLTDRRAPRDLPFTEVEPQIRQYLRQQQQEQKSDAFVAQLKAKSKIEVFI
jgi:peptidyl-prolyl cis-trans isomerase C